MLRLGYLNGSVAAMGEGELRRRRRFAEEVMGERRDGPEVMGGWLILSVR